MVAPQGQQTRPTSDRLRETLFNVVAPYIEGTIWLDLFAGSGAVGIEALSRGASSVYFVESAGMAIRTIRRNLQTLGISAEANVLEQDVITALRTIEAQNVGCDFAFLDPPYRKLGDYDRVLSFLSRSQLLNFGAQVIAEHDKHFDPGDAFELLQRQRILRQGDAVLSFYARRSEAE